MVALVQEFFAEQPLLGAVSVIAGSVALAFVIEFIIRRTLVVAARRTVTDVDDHIVEALRRPIFFSVVLTGLGLGSHFFGLEESVQYAVSGALKTTAVVLWAIALMRIGSLLVHSIGSHPRAKSVLQPRTVPVFDMLLKMVVVGAAIYFVFVAWDLDLTAWLASAGILGIALGFAAKDTLGNLFSGIFILADGPYQLGDWIIIDGTIRGNLRGRVTHIGMRSTRILTRDDVEITVPNAMIANSQLINEMGGPEPKQRVRVPVDVAYGSDIDEVRRVLLACAKDHDMVAESPAPAVRFRRFGGSGLAFELLVYLDDPSARGLLIDQLNCRVYKAFEAADIEIPYTKQDLYIKEMPGHEPLD
ncbi:MAG: mechanosensitive ion channel family protein [Myxococcota bacterium]